MKSFYQIAQSCLNERATSIGVKGLVTEVSFHSISDGHCLVSHTRHLGASSHLQVL